MDTFSLKFGYSRNSTLPRRQFVVSVKAFVANFDEPQFFNLPVEAPDPNAAEGIVRRYFNDNPSVTGFMIELVREVEDSRTWNGGESRYQDAPVVSVPHWFEHRLPQLR